MTGKRFGKFKTINFANAGNYNALLTQQDNFFWNEGDEIDYFCVRMCVHVHVPANTL